MEEYREEALFALLTPATPSGTTSLLGFRPIFLLVNDGCRSDNFCNTYQSKLALEFKTDLRSKVIC